MRLFTVAYIYPDKISPFIQCDLVAKYPIAIVPQSDDPVYIAWRDRIRQLNPAIKLLAYQQTIYLVTEIAGPGVGPGARVMAAESVPAQLSVSRLPNGPYFDYRIPAFKTSFLHACDAVLKSYPYDGLFLDNCTVWGQYQGTDVAGLTAALRSTILELRARQPNILIVTNGIEKYVGANGGMCEARPLDMAKEMPYYDGQAFPRINMFHDSYPNESSQSQANTNYLSAMAIPGCLYGGHSSGQQISRLPLQALAVT